MKTIKISSVLVLLFFCLATISIFGQPYIPPPANAPNPGEHKMRQQPPYLPPNPDLSKDQIEDIKKLEIAHQKEILPLENQVREKEAKLQSSATTDKPDLVQLNSIIDEISILKGKIQKSDMAHRQNIRKLLTEEQRVVFDSHPPRHPGNRPRIEN